jgi:hypothetical protein
MKFMETLYLTGKILEGYMPLGERDIGNSLRDLDEAFNFFNKICHYCRNEKSCKDREFLHTAISADCPGQPFGLQVYGQSFDVRHEWTDPDRVITCKNIDFDPYQLENGRQLQLTECVRRD